MTATLIQRPGRRVEATPAQLVSVDEETPIANEWRERMREIAESERTAENEDKNIRIR